MLPLGEAGAVEGGELGGVAQQLTVTLTNITGHRPQFLFHPPFPCTILLCTGPRASRRPTPRTRSAPALSRPGRPRSPQLRREAASPRTHRQLGLGKRHGLVQVNALAGCEKWVVHSVAQQSSVAAAWLPVSAIVAGQHIVWWQSSASSSCQVMVCKLV